MAQGKALSSDDKKVIVALKEYFDRTENNLEEQSSPSVNTF